MLNLKKWFNKKRFDSRHSKILLNNNKVLDALLGVSVGDALGVPFEFKSKEEMEKNPAVEMVGFGTHNQPKGTWSDDSSLTFCLAESLTKDFDLKNISEKFILWKNKSYWTPHGVVFDIGFTTSKAISRLEDIIRRNKIEELKTLKYFGSEDENGNGSLMRILPLLFYIKGKKIDEQFEIVWQISALTHRHVRAAMSCLIYLRFAEKILVGIEKNLAYEQTRNEIILFWDGIKFSKNEKQHFKKLIQNHILDTRKEDLKTSGYVIDVLESSFWFFLKCKSYKETVLSIINLGNDTDTSAAIAGGLAGLYYGKKNIPKDWINTIACLQDIFTLGEKLNKIGV